MRDRELTSALMANADRDQTGTLTVRPDVTSPKYCPRNAGAATHHGYHYCRPRAPAVVLLRAVLTVHGRERHASRGPGHKADQRPPLPVVYPRGRLQRDRRIEEASRLRLSRRDPP